MYSWAFAAAPPTMRLVAPVNADELIAHHAARCTAIVEACQFGPRTAAELVPVIFGRAIDDPHQLVFAFGEALAHVNTMIRAGRLRVGSTERGLALEAA